MAISFRTLSHYPTQINRSALDTISYILACFTLTCFTIEFCYMGWVVNYLQGRKTNRMSVVQKNMRQVMFDGLNHKSVKKSWFIRNYNLLYLLRFFVFMGFLFGLQYLQIFQALFSFVLMISFTILTIYYQLAVGIFDSLGTSILKVIQECSIAIIMILVNTFCVDSFEKILSSKAKTIMVMIFMVLLILNIVLEVLSVIISVILLCKKPNKVRPDELETDETEEVGRILDIDPPTPLNRGKSKVRMKRKRKNNNNKNKKKNNKHNIRNEKKKIKDNLRDFMQDRQEIKLMPPKNRRSSAQGRMLRNHLAKSLMSRKGKKSKLSKK